MWMNAFKREDLTETITKILNKVQERILNILFLGDIL